MQSTELKEQCINAFKAIRDLQDETIQKMEELDENDKEFEENISVVMLRYMVKVEMVKDEYKI